MTRLASRSVLSAVLALVALVLVLTTAGLLRPDTADADPPRSSGKAAHASAKQGKAPKRHGQKHVKKHARKHAEKKRLSRGLRAVQLANRLTGTPYVWGGSSPRTGFDCSGLVQYVYGKVGIPLPHYTVSLYGRGRAVPRSRLRPGDLVFFSGLHHVGIYAGGGKYIHAPRAGTTVRWASLASHPNYYGARRIVAT